MDLRAAVLASFVTVLLTADSTAQCLQWDDQFRRTGLTGSAACGVSFDDGSGPALYVGGNFTAVSDLPLSRLARWNGASWSAVGGAPDSEVYSLHVHDDGSGPALYAAGSFTAIGSTSVARIARWNGSSWSALGSGMNAAVHALKTFDDGSGPALYAGGWFTSAGGTSALGVARWNGTSWSNVGAGLGSFGPAVYAFETFDEGSGPRLFACGWFDTSGSTSLSNIARWDGMAWSALPGAFDSGCFSMRTFNAGGGNALYVGGTFTTVDSILAAHVARWNGIGWSSPGAGLGGPAGGSIVSTLQAFDDGTGPQLYAGGSFSISGTPSSSNLARWNGTSWAAVSTGTDGTVRALVAHDEGAGPRQFVIGDFRRAGAADAGGVARWDGASLTALEQVWGASQLVLELLSVDDATERALYVGGDFTSIGGIQARHVARFDGLTWSPLADGLAGKVTALARLDMGSGPRLIAGIEPATAPTPTVTVFDAGVWTQLPGTQTLTGSIYAFAVFDDGSGAALYMGGYFTASAPGYGTFSSLARWRNGALERVGNWMTGSYVIHSLKAFEESGLPRLFIGGQFDSAAGLPIRMLARWNGSAFTQVGSGLDGPLGYSSVNDLEVHDDGTGRALYAGGSFLTAGGVDAAFLARWTGSTWENVGNGTSEPVLALKSFDDGSGRGPALIAGGYFAQTDGLVVNGIARWDGTTWEALGSGLASSAQIRCLASFGTLGARDLFAGGNFHSVGGETAHYLARWKGCGQTGELFCFGDGSGMPCPCANRSAVGARDGCLNSLGLAGRLRATGEPRIAADTLVLHGSQMANGSALYFQGTTRLNTGYGLMFGDGLRCAGGSVLRLRAKPSVGGASQYPSSGDPEISVQGGVLAPGTRTYQVRYRNVVTFCTNDSFNLTNGLEIVWRP